MKTLVEISEEAKTENEDPRSLGLRKIQIISEMELLLEPFTGDTAQIRKYNDLVDRWNTIDKTDQLEKKVIPGD